MYLLICVGGLSSPMAPYLLVLPPMSVTRGFRRAKFLLLFMLLAYISLYFLQTYMFLPPYHTSPQRQANYRLVIFLLLSLAISGRTSFFARVAVDLITLEKIANKYKSQFVANISHGSFNSCTLQLTVFF